MWFVPLAGLSACVVLFRVCVCVVFTYPSTLIVMLFSSRAMFAFFSALAASCLLAAPASALPYSEVTATRGAQFCAASYCEQSGVEDWDCAACMDSGRTLTNVTSFFDEITEVYGFVAVEPAENQIVIAFRGYVNAAWGGII